MILKLFSSRPEHPLGDAKALKRILSALPGDNALKLVDEVHGWFESLRQADGFAAGELFDIVRQLDEAAQPQLDRLTRDYLYSPRLSKNEERRLWSVCFNYWGEVAGLYALCSDGRDGRRKARVPETSGDYRPLALARLVAARAKQQKWISYRYGVIGDDLWRGMARPYWAAVAAGCERASLALYPGLEASGSVEQQYLRALVLASSSTDSLMPQEIELADRLIGLLLPSFVFSGDCRSDSLYWIDVAEGGAPVRLAQLPVELSPDMRFISPGDAPQALAEMIRLVEAGELPPGLASGQGAGSEVPVRRVLAVLGHLASYWAVEPPQRSHPRHPMKTRMAVVHGFDDCFTLFSGNLARLGKERSAESWVVENVSLGGFRARAETVADWLTPGVLLGMQPDGSESWGLGVVRRFSKEADDQAAVGIQSLSRQARSIELRPRTAGLSATGALPGICLGGCQAAGELRVVLPLSSFDARESLEFVDDGRRCLLLPVELEMSGGDFEIARYQSMVSE